MSTSHRVLHGGLLLLPAPPRPPSISTLKAAYEPPIKVALLAVCKSPSQGALDVALPLMIADAQSRASYFAEVSELVGGLYDLVVNVSEDLRLPSTGAGSVDVRIMPIQYDPNHTYEVPITPREFQLEVPCDIPRLFGSQRPWHTLYTVESEEGEEIFRKLRAVATARFGDTTMQTLTNQPQRLKGGLVLHGQKLSEHSGTTNMCPHERAIIYNNLALPLDTNTKTLITMGAFLLPARHSGRACSSRAREIVFVSENTPSDQLIEAIVDFLSCIGDFRPPSSQSNDLVVHGMMGSLAPADALSVRLVHMSSTELSELNCSDVPTALIQGSNPRWTVTQAAQAKLQQESVDIFKIGNLTLDANRRA